MPLCCVRNCYNSDKNSMLMMFSFPKEEERRKAWIDFVGEDFVSKTSSSRVCEAHFDNSQWIKKSVKLKPDAIPSLKCNFCPDKPQRRSKKTTHQDHLDQFYFFKSLWESEKEKSPESKVLSDHNYAKNLGKELIKNESVQIKNEPHDCVIRYKSPSIVYPKQIFSGR